MINVPTVFILGAGASVPYGYPTGPELKNLIVQSLATDSSPSRILLKGVGFEHSHITNFVQSLSNSGKISIDAFLEHRKDLLAIGKSAIAMKLIECENHNLQFSSENKDNWYQHLFNKMNAKPEDVLKNNLSFITFNYDRSLENFFYTALKNSYNLTSERTTELVNSIPIIHLHGFLGPLPWQEVGGRPYSSTLSSEVIGEASQNIWIVHDEEVNKSPAFAQARKKLDQAQCIYFLGFGYDLVNLNRLGYPTTQNHRALFGSVYGLTDFEISRLKKRFGAQLSCGRHDEKNLLYLRAHADLG